MGEKKTRSRKHSTMTSSNVRSIIDDMDNDRLPLLTTSSLECHDELIVPTKSSTTTADPETRINREGVALVCLDVSSQSNYILFGLLRSLNDNIETFTDSTLCLDWIRSSSDPIFFISSSSDKDLLTSVHTCTTVEAIFILNSKAQVSKNDFPKLAGVFNQHEELFMVLEEMLTWFERGKLEMFMFEENNIFLWSQLWNEERINTKVTSGKGQLVDMTRNYYRGNTKMLKLLDTFYQSYRSSDAFQWCFRSPFPARFLNHALHSHNSEQLRFYSFLLNDTSRLLKQQSKHNSRIELYQGMKLPTELVEKFEKHTEKLICASGYFMCTKSRTAAMALASSSSRHPNFSSVLFKIDCDPSTSFAELSIDGKSGQIVFDIHTTFRLMYVNHGQMSVIKMKTANEEGRQLAKEYKKKHNKENIHILLDELLVGSQPPTSSLTSPPLTARTAPVEISSSTVSREEIQAQEHLARGEIDLALVAYRRIQPVLPRILNLIGKIYTEKLNNNESALVCHMQALKMQGEKGEDISDTLTSLGIIYYNRHECDLAVSYHTRALMLREANHPSNLLLIANNLHAIANAYWAQCQLPQALESAQRALSIHQSVMPSNAKNVALSLCTLANIHHEYDDDARALEVGTQALVLLEHCVPTNSSILAALFHNLGAFHLGLGALQEARNSFEKALIICTDIVSPEHPKRIALENHIQNIIQLQKKSTEETTNGIGQ